MYKTLDSCALTVLCLCLSLSYTFSQWSPPLTCPPPICVIMTRCFETHLTSTGLLTLVLSLEEARHRHGNVQFYHSAFLWTELFSFWTQHRETDLTMLERDQRRVPQIQDAISAHLRGMWPADFLTKVLWKYLFWQFISMWLKDNRWDQVPQVDLYDEWLHFFIGRRCGS